MPTTAPVDDPAETSGDSLIHSVYGVTGPFSTNGSYSASCLGACFAPFPDECRTRRSLPHMSPRTPAAEAVRFEAWRLRDIVVGGRVLS